MATDPIPFRNEAQDRSSTTLAEPKVRRTKEKKYWRLGLSEEDLVRLATIVAKLAANSGHQKSVEIEIVSADGEDKLESTDPTVFTCRDMPAKVGSVTISYGSIWDSSFPAACRLHLEAGPFLLGAANLKVTGTDPTLVTGIFGDLDHQIQVGTKWGGWLNRVIMAPMWPVAVLSSLIWCLSLAALIAAQSLALRLIGLGPDTRLYQNLGVLFVAASAYAAISGWLAWLFFDAARKALPVVEFTGRLSDDLSGYRARLVFLCVVLVFPIIANGLYDLLKATFIK